MTVSRLGSYLRYAAAALSIIMLLAVCCDPADAKLPLYAINDLAPLCTTLEGHPPEMSGAAINQRGDITGNLFCTSSGTMYIYDSATDQVSIVEPPGSTVFAINNKQQIAGTHFRGENFAFIETGGRLIMVGLVGENFAVDLNDSGVVVGGLDFGQISEHAFKWKAGKLTDIDPQLGGRGSVASAINDRNEITGDSNALGAFLLSPTGKVTQLGTLGGSATTPQAINIYAEITGCSMRSDGTAHAFLWQRHRLHDLGPSGMDSCGAGINSDGVVVGCTLLSGSLPGFGACAGSNGPMQLPATFALLWRDGDVYDLNQLIDKSDPLYGTITLYGATGINDAGQIVANGCFTAGTSKGRCTAVRLDPVIEVAHR
jgi:uncharacterized membrane protein